MGDGFQINGFIKIKQYKRDGTVIRNEKLYNKVTDIGRLWFLHKGSAPILQNNLANFGQSDFFSQMDTYSSSASSYRIVNNLYPCNFLFNLSTALYNAHKAAGGAKNFIGDKTTIPDTMGFAGTQANPAVIQGTATKQGLIVDATNVGITEDFKVSQTWRYPEGCAVGSINAIGMAQSGFAGNLPTMAFAKCITPRIPNAEKDVGTVQAYIPPNVVYNRGESDEVIWTKPNEIIVHTTGGNTLKIELTTGKCTELKPSDLGYNLDFIPSNVAAYINCTLYGVNKVLYVAKGYSTIRIVDITDTTMSVTTGNAVIGGSSGSSLNTSPVSMFTKVVNGERHIFIIGTWYYYSTSYYVSEWKLDGTRISISSGLDLQPALNQATGGDYTTTDFSIVSILDAGDSIGYVALTKANHKKDGTADFTINCGRYFTNIVDYGSSVTDRALMTDNAAFITGDKLCSIFFGYRSESINYDNSNYGPTRANLMFSKEGWAGNLISMKLLQDPIIKGEDDILDITYGYEIGERNDQ